MSIRIGNKIIASNVDPDTLSVSYLNATNKPSINSVVLEGNKKSSDLGLQDKLVSGTTIKTINGEPILGSGDIKIEAGTQYAMVVVDHTI